AKPYAFLDDAPLEERRGDAGHTRGSRGLSVGDTPPPPRAAPHPARRERPPRPPDPRPPAPRAPPPRGRARPAAAPACVGGGPGSSLVWGARPASASPRKRLSWLLPSGFPRSWLCIPAPPWIRRSAFPRRAPRRAGPPRAR